MNEQKKKQQFTVKPQNVLLSGLCDLPSCSSTELTSLSGIGKLKQLLMVGMGSLFFGKHLRRMMLIKLMIPSSSLAVGGGG